MSKFLQTSKTPYYAVIFSSTLNKNTAGYEEMSAKMVDLASKHPGFLGIESAREDIGITVSYWDSLASIKNWKAHLEHKEAQSLGREKWYSHYKVRIAKVEREYEF